MRGGCLEPEGRHQLPQHGLFLERSQHPRICRPYMGRQAGRHERARHGVRRADLGSRSISVRRGKPQPDLRQAGRASSRRRHAVCRVGAERRAGERGRAVQPMGRPMSSDRNRGSSGVWELSIPGVGEGALYKYEMRARDGRLFLKADPYGFAMQLRPGNSSVVASLDGYEWQRRRMDASPRAAPIRVAVRSTPMRCTWARGGARGIRGAALHELAGGGQTADPVRHGDGLHAHRTDGRRRASARRILGLPGGGLLRGDPRYGPPRGFHALRRLLSPAPASA